MTVIWAVRHAPVQLPGICYGQSEVEPTLSVDEATAIVRDRLGSEVPAYVWSSPWRRCADVARALAAGWSAPHAIDARLSELSFGTWEGRAWAEIEGQDPDRYRRWMARWESEAPPSGEAPPQLMARVAEWVDALEPRGPHLLIAHAGVVRALRVRLLGQSWQQAMSEPVDWLTRYVFPGLAP